MADNPIGSQAWVSNGKRRAAVFIRNHPVRPWIPLAGLLLVAAALRLYALGRDPLWYDEVMYAAMCKHLAGSVLLSRHVLVEPAFCAFFYVWMWFGTSDTWLRMHAVLAGVATVGVAYLLGTRLAGRRGGLSSALVAAAAPFLVYYGRDAKMYAWVALLELAIAYTTLRYAASDGRRAHLAAYAVSAVLLLHTHAVSPVYLASVNLLFVAMLRPSWRKLLVWCAVQVAVVAAAVPYALAAAGYYGAMEGKHFWASPGSTAALWRTASNFAVGYHGTPAFRAAGVVLLALLCAVALTRATRRRETIFCASAAALQIAVLFALSQTAGKSFYVDRYMIGSSVLLLALAGVGLSVLPGRWVRVAGLAFVLAGFSFSLTQIYANRLTPTRSHHEGVSRTDDLHAMADTIRRHALPGDRILHLRYESLAQLRWYLPELPQVVVDMGELAVRELDSKAIPSAQRLAGFEPVEIESAVSGVARVWVVATELVPGVMGLHEGLLDWLQARGQETAARQFGGRYAFSRVLLFDLGKTPDRARPSDSFLYAREDGMPEDEYWVPDEVDVRWVKDEASGCRVTLAARGPSGADLLYDVISADAVVNAPTLDRAAAGNSRWRLQEYRDRQRSYMAYHTRVDGSSKADDVLRGSFDLPAGRYTVFVQRLAAGPEFAVPTANLRLCLGERTFDVSGEAAGGRGGWTWCRAGDWHHSGDGHVKLTIEATDPAKRPEALATFSRVVLRRSDAAAGSEAPEWLRGALHIPAGGTNTLTLPDDMPATQADLTVSGTTGSARVSMRRDAGGTLIAEPAVEPLPAEASDGRANVLLVLLDTLRADCLDDSRPDMPMPKLSRLATESWRFDNAMAQATWTKPSMASLFTSLYPGVHRVQFGTGSLLPDAEYREVDALPSAFETWAEYLRQAGYRTAAVQTNANVQAGLGFEQGFDSYVNAYDAYARASRVTDTALAQLSAPGPPFFLYAHYMDAHRPYAPPPQYLAHYNDLLAALSNDQRQAVFRLQREADPDPETEAALSEDGRRCLRALYDAGAGYLDDEASRLIEQVRLRFPNTIVIIAADHGEEFWEHGQLGHGSTVYQEVAHVPLLMSLPGKAPRRIREPVELIDVLPTVADALGLPASPAWQGRSLLAEIPSRPVYTQTRSSSRTPNLHWEAVMDGRRKLVVDIGGGDARCYDLLSDPAERNGIREGEEPERLGRLLSEHRARYEQHPLCKVPAETRRISPEAAEALNALGYM